MPHSMRQVTEHWVSGKGLVPLLALLIVGCAPADPRKIVNPMDLSTPSGEPKITGVTDLGSVPLVLNRPLANDKSDGVAVVGELLVIRGKNLGRQPTVAFGSKPMAVLARTADGGIVVRAPDASSPGEHRITVSHERGSTSHAMTLKRYGLATVPGVKGALVLDIGADSVTPLGKPLLDEAPSFMALHRDGAVAYATTGGSRPSVQVIDLAAAGGPKVVGQRPLGEWKVLGLAACTEGKTLVAVHETAIIVFLLDDPRDPLRYNPARFPSGVAKAGVVDIKLSPDGKTLAVLLQRNNSLVLFDVSDPNRVRNTDFLPLLPEAKESLVRSLHFSFEPDSSYAQVLWVATGDTPLSQQVGKHPAKLLKLGVKSAPDRTQLPTITPLGEVPLDDTHSPLEITSSYAVSEIVSASVLRRESSRMSIFASMMHPDLFVMGTQPLNTPTGLQQGAELLRKLGNYGMILRTDPKGNRSTFLTTPGIMSSIALTGDGRMLLAITCQPRAEVDPSKVVIPCGLLTTPTEQSAASVLPLGELPLGAFVPPFNLGQILLQP